MAIAISISILEPNPEARASLVAALQAKPGLQLHSASASLEEALGLLQANPVNVMLCGIASPHAVGIDWVASCRTRFPDTQVIALSDRDDADIVVKAVQAGASGFLPKTASVRDLVQAVQQIHGDGSPMSPQIARKLVGHLQQQIPSAGSALDKLSGRERQVLELLAEGRSCKSIATVMRISPSTVNAHAHAVYTKLGVRTRTQAVVMLLKCRSEDLAFSMPQPSCRPRAVEEEARSRASSQPRPGARRPLALIPRTT